MQLEPRRAALLAAVLAGLVASVCCLGLLAFNFSAPRTTVAFGYSVQVCVGVNTIPRLQLGVNWISPLMSSLPPVLLQNPSCAIVPWLPFLPQRGGFTFPP
jgi:hypothetical protein